MLFDRSRQVAGAFGNLNLRFWDTGPDALSSEHCVRGDSDSRDNSGQSKQIIPNQLPAASDFRWSLSIPGIRNCPLRSSDTLPVFAIYLGRHGHSPLKSHSYRKMDHGFCTKGYVACEIQVSAQRARMGQVAVLLKPEASVKKLLAETADRAAQYVTEIANRRVSPLPADVARLEALGAPLPESPSEPSEILALLDDMGSPATVATAG